ncbi:MAG: hypothetical protein JSW51_10325 [Gemmatimonadota bacterium]|nr:MAG: hypothetical protein JSW51_10325 [Gemmatimonadota bacterium]
MRPAFVMVLITFGLTPPGVTSQPRPTTVNIVEKVRVRAVCNYGGYLATLTDPGACQVRLEGRLEAIRSDTLIVSTNGAAPERIPIEDIVRVEVRRGTKSHAREGLLIGALSGTLLGALYGAMTYEPCAPSGTGMLSGLECLMAPESAGEAAVWGGMAGGLLGGAVGALIGLMVRTDKWLPASQLHRDLNSIVVPRGVGIGASLRF